MEYLTILLLLETAESSPHLLSVSSFMILEPVEYIFPFDLPIVREMGGYLPYLSSIRSSDTSPIHLLEYHELLRRRTPSGRRCGLLHRLKSRETKRMMMVGSVEWVRNEQGANGRV